MTIPPKLPVALLLIYFVSKFQRTHVFLSPKVVIQPSENCIFLFIACIINDDELTFT